MFFSIPKALVPVSFLLLHSASAQSCQSLKSQITHYGLGSAGVYTAFECPGQAAGTRTYEGDGSYGNPGAAAVTDGDPKYPRCSMIYIPRYKKYFRINDKCAACDNQKVDLWVGPSPGPSDTDETVYNRPGREAAAACETQFGTTDASIILNPPKDLPVQTKSLYDGSTCHNNDDSYVFANNQATCSGGGGDSDGNGDGQQEPPASSPAVDPPAYTSPPIIAQAPPATGEKLNVEKLNVEKPKPSSSSDTDDQTLPTDLPLVDLSSNKKLAYVPPPDNPPASSTSSASDSGPSGESTYTGDRTKGAPCPPNDWFPGCVWGSGSGQLGASCSVKTDCFGDYVCIGGKCMNNVNPGNKARRSMRHRRRHLGERAIEGVKH